MVSATKNMNKLEDDLFLAEIKQHDVIFLAETHIGNDQNISVEGYHSFTVCRPKSRNNRHFGGLAILTRKDIKQFVSILPNTHKDYQWVKFDKNFFGLNHDLFVCVVYYPPSQSVYMHNLSMDIFQLLEKDIVNYQAKGEILLCGDFNARTGVLSDFIASDVTENDDYSPDRRTRLKSAPETQVVVIWIVHNHMFLMHIIIFLGLILKDLNFRRPETDVCVLVDVLSEPNEAEVWGEGGVVLKQGLMSKKNIFFLKTKMNSNEICI